MNDFSEIIQKRVKLQKSLSTIDDRDKEPDALNPNFKHYEYNLSHTRSIARISSAADRQYFSGSSLLRKEKPANETGQILTLAEAFTKLELQEQKNRRARIERIKKVRKAKFMEDKGMSRRTRIKIKEKMMSVFAASKNNFTLQTLTLVAPAADWLAVKCLNKYLTVLRKKSGLFNYVWVAERQGNGNVHFHMILDRKFDIVYTNSLWVSQQESAGIKNEIACLKFKNDYNLTFKQAHKRGEITQKLVQQYLNPVDVIKVKNIDGMSAYLTNYVTKNETKMQCAVWHCNRNVSKLFTKQLISKKVFEKTCSKLNCIYSKKGKAYINKTFVHQYGMINNIFNKKYFNTFLKEMNLLNSWILANEKIDCGVKIEYDTYKKILYGYDYDTGEITNWSIKKYETRSEILYNKKNGINQTIYKSYKPIKKQQLN